MNPAVHRILTELSVIERIGEENIVEDLDSALKKGVDYIANKHLDCAINP